MRRVCLVNSFNYAQFLPACLSSIELQSTQFDLVVVVDDGSSDQSRGIIESYCNRLSGWVALFKSNGGQLSCFNACVQLVEEDDIVTFLDADDVYPADYLASLLRRVDKHQADFYFGEAVQFQDGKAQPLISAVLCDRTDFVIPCSSAMARRFGAWIGSPTSAIAVRGRLLKDILPYPHEREWVTRADDVLVFGASLLGASKVYMPGVGVGYRVHGNNGFLGKKYSAGYIAQRAHKLEKLFGWYCQKQSIPVEACARLAVQEHVLVPNALLKRLQVHKVKTTKSLSLLDRWSLWNRRRKFHSQSA
ncbi:glycosyltransferase family 2 protein [Aquabacterium sp.]|uniref:glycosyltransferase family 2 protein n=1 Tax=Aquabacterium sp. TaxID=1872578 RepID=UPI0035B4F697